MLVETALCVLNWWVVGFCHHQTMSPVPVRSPRRVGSSAMCHRSQDGAWVRNFVLSAGSFSHSLKTPERGGDDVPPATHYSAGNIHPYKSDTEGGRKDVRPMCHDATETEHGSAV